MPNLGPAYDFGVRIKRLEDLLSRMGQNPYGQAFSATQSDGTVGMSVTQDITGAGATAMRFMQGPTTPVDPQTGQHPLLMYVGQGESGGVLGDSVALYFYPDGLTESMVVGAGGVGIKDAKGNVVFTTDEPAGEGLGKPWLAMPIPQPAAETAWPSTNATSWGALAYSQVIHQSPKVSWIAFVVSDAGVTGQVRLNVGGTYSGVHPITSTATVISDVVALPAGFQGQQQLITVEAQVTGGTGNVRVLTYSLYGRGS